MTMEHADFQYRNNDPSENVEASFSDARGRKYTLSFVATRPHWCEESDIFGDLFASPLTQVLAGEVYPLSAGSSEEAEIIEVLRSFVESTIPDWRAILQRRQPTMSETDSRDRSLVWLLTAIERRRSRLTATQPEPGSPANYSKRH
jgi:hypothetical protein